MRRLSSALRSARPESHLVENILLQVDTRCNFRQLQAIRRQAEDAALGDIDHLLAAPGRLAAAEGTMLDLAHELDRLAVLDDAQAPIADRHLQIAGHEGADEDDLLG